MIYFLVKQLNAHNRLGAVNCIRQHSFSLLRLVFVRFKICYMGSIGFLSEVSIDKVHI